MEELIKALPNGQWVLEKAKKVDPEAMRQIQEFLSRQKKAPTAAAPVTAPKSPTEGMRPVQHATGANPQYSKEAVAAIRAGIPATVDNGLAPVPAKQKVAMRDQAKTSAMDQSDEERGKVMQGRKAAWEATTKFLAERGGEKQQKNPEAMGAGYGYGEKTGGENKGWAAMNAQLQQKKQFDQAQATGKPMVKPTKPEMIPPQEMIRDANGQSSMQTRQGRMHNEGARTRGKIVHTAVSYPTGEKDAAGQPIMAHTSTPQQEEHVWSWDHGKKKWNHVKTQRVPVGK